MRLLTSLLFWGFCLQETSLLPFGRSLTSGHLQILEQIFPNSTENAQVIVAGVPDTVAESFPKFDQTSFGQIHPDVFWRLPDETILDSSGFSGSALADLVLKSFQDASVIRKASSVLADATESEKLDFLDNLAGLTSYKWKIIGKVNLHVRFQAAILH